MKKFTQKQLKALAFSHAAEDLSAADKAARLIQLRDAEGLDQIGYASGVYGCAGKLLQSRATGKLYVIIGRVSALYVV